MMRTFWTSGDESSVPLFDPETKSSSMQWLGPGKPHPQKALRGCAHRSTMITVFFDKGRTVFLDFLPRGETITAEYYCGILRTLKERLRRKRPHLWSKSHDGEHRNFLLHHDNASSHTAIPTLALIGESDINMVPHPPYSPDLVPCDFFYFPE